MRSSFPRHNRRVDGIVVDHGRQPLAFEVRFSVREHLDIHDDALRLVWDALMRMHAETDMRFQIADHHPGVAVLARPFGRGQFIWWFHGRRSIIQLLPAAIGEPVTNVQPLRIADAARAIRHVFIRNLELDAHIGVHGHERGRGQPIRVNVDLAVEDLASLEDRLELVVDYEAITKKIRAIVEAGHVNLAETLAERIASACFEDARVKTARVRIEKLHALPGAESAGVEIERTRA